MTRRLAALSVTLLLSMGAIGISAAAAGSASSTPQPQAYRDQPPLAYVSDGRLFVLDGKGSPPTRVRGVKDACCVAFSPDGYSIAFRQGSDLWVVDHDGTDLRRIARAVERWAWAPDGQVLAVIPKEGPEAAGNGVDFYGARDPRISETLLPEYRALDLAWAGFGRRLAVSAVRAGPSGVAEHAEVFILEVPGPAGEDCPAMCPEAPLPIPVEHGAGASGPLFAGWSPDVDAIAVLTAPQDGATLGVVSPRGGGITPIAGTLVRRSWVQWSMTGDRLLVVEGRAPESRAPRALLLCTRVEGCSSITGGNEPVADPAWSRSGAMAYVRTERRQLWVASSDGSDARRVHAAKGVHAPRWLPDTRHLVFVANRLAWLLDTTSGRAVPIAGPLGGTGKTTTAPAREPTDHSPGTRWEELYAIAP
jgi:Tol biopolymer transport system component